jgi:hypothetical protein
VSDDGAVCFVVVVQRSIRVGCLLLASLFYCLSAHLNPALPLPSLWSESRMIVICQQRGPGRVTTVSPALVGSSTSVKHLSQSNNHTQDGSTGR